MDWFVRPGKYQIALSLSDLSTGQHSIMLKKLHVPGIKHDPLPDIWTNLPSVEFWAPFREVGLQQSFHSDIQGRLHLPLVTKHPVRLDVLADVTPSDFFAGHQGAYTRYLFNVLATWKDFIQIEPADGSINGALLDFRQQKVIWERKNIRTVNWEDLKNVLEQKTVAQVTTRELQTGDNPIFLRKELARRTSESTGDALHVVVLIGSPLDHYKLPRLPPVPAPKEKTVVYLLQFRSWDSFPDDRPIRDMFSPLTVRALRLGTAEDIRHALALIMSEIAQAQ